VGGGGRKGKGEKGTVPLFRTCLQCSSHGPQARSAQIGGRKRGEREEDRIIPSFSFLHRGRSSRRIVQASRSARPKKKRKKGGGRKKRRRRKRSFHLIDMLRPGPSGCCLARYPRQAKKKEEGREVEGRGGLILSPSALPRSPVFSRGETRPAERREKRRKKGEGKKKEQPPLHRLSPPFPA